MPAVSLRLSAGVTLCAALLVVLSLTGCVAKSEHEALQAELDACREATAAAEADAALWQQRFDRESSRWEQIGTSVEDALPRALNELEDERRRLLDAVPDQVQSEVAAYLDEYRSTMMAGFQAMRDDNEEIRIQLLASQKALEAIGADTRSIGEAIVTSLSTERAKRATAAEDLVDIVDLIVEFDQTRLTCDRCPDRLKMRDRSREEIVAFHAELIQDLNKVSTFARDDGAPPSDGDGEVSGAGDPIEEGGEAASEG
ncbi:MAG: hypothetical protein AAGC60_27580 [Acidobacteriota bacterium]